MHNHDNGKSVTKCRESEIFVIVVLTYIQFSISFHDFYNAKYFWLLA